MSRIRLCFLGTPEFAVVSLRRLIEDNHYEIVGVVTQPDRPAGRQLQLTPSPVKKLALSAGLTVISPLKINQDLEPIKNWKAEVAVVVAFGQILSTEFLNLFPFGAVNVHGSVLPRWRGAAPIQRALEAGDTASGVTLQKIVKELDAGDVIGVRHAPVPEDMTALELHDELAILGADLLHVELMDYMRGHLAPVPQPLEGVTYAKKIDKSECQINWSLPARQIHNKVRGFLMGPGTYALHHGKKLKLHRTKIQDSNGQAQPGTVVKASGGQLWVQANPGVVSIVEIQPESRNKMKAEDFLKGITLREGDRFDS